MDGKKRLSRAAMLVLLGSLSILFSGASTLGRGDLLFKRRITVNTQRSKIAADMDAAIMIDKLANSKNDQIKKEEGKSSTQLARARKEHKKHYINFRVFELM